jgi:hypothetical protein
MVFSGALVMKRAKTLELDKKLYLKSKNRALNVLLILDNAPQHPQDLCLTHLNTQLENLSNITTSLPQTLITEFVTTLKSAPHLH